MRPLARSIDFESEVTDDPLIAALRFLKASFDSGKSLAKISQEDFPKNFIPNNLAAYLYESPERKNLNIHKYEFLVYSQLQKNIDTGRIFVNNSFSFKSLNTDLLGKTLWKRKEKILKTLQNS